jgi:uncharacterized membrane protein (UPF0182 family)
MRSKKWLLVVAGAGIAMVVVLVSFAGYYGDWLWFQNLGFGQVFLTELWAKAVVSCGAFIVFALFAGLNLWYARRLGRPTRAIQVVDHERPITALELVFRGDHAPHAWVAAILLLSAFMGLTASTSWMTFLQFLHGSRFGVADPIFGKDAGFYVFYLPFYSLVLQWFFFWLFITFAVVAISYYLDGAVGVAGDRSIILPRVTSHMAVLAGFFFVGLAVSNRLKLYKLLYSGSGVAYGTSYADVSARIPAYWTLLALAVATAFVLFLMPAIRKWRWALGLVGLYVVVLVAFGSIYPALVEQYIVKPNELAKETPYIENNIRLTRLGFGLNEAKEEPFPVRDTMSYDDIKKNEATIRNIRLWDHRPLVQTYKQLQEIRLYYDFNSVDVDRYRFGDRYSQVAIAARELPPSQLPDRAKTWVNMHLLYTHGYGVVMSPVNEFTADGMPEFIMQDIPPRTSTPLKITRPEIYYGKETNGFTLVHTRSKEFDYPKGNQNVYTEYQGKGGVQISSFFRRLVYTVDLSDINILFSTYITDESRLMLHRVITDRDRTIAPFLTYDSDPYIVVGDDGHLYWIHDAYTTSNMFPYSEPMSWTAGQAHGINYIRNSVKVVIDAYNGTVSYYVMDPADPVVQTYRKIFPSLFKPIQDMPGFLRTHVRYPMDLFAIQAQMYSTYHMTDPQVFYNREDLWSIPQEIFKNSQQQLLPYYIIMRLPDSRSEEFILMLPLTPAKKDNMVAWMCARCDGDNYGQLLIYTLSKEKLIYGPMQIEARINQQPSISSALTLWGQQGSSVIRGNLLIIPIEHSFIYVEPIYLQSEQGELPQLKRVIAVHNGELAMGKDLDDALSEVFATAGTPEAQQREAVAGGTVTETLSTLAQEALDHYNKAEAYLKNANWSKYGDELNQLEEILRKMTPEKTEAPAKTPSASPAPETSRH